MVNDFWLKNKHTISIFQAQVRGLAKHIEAQPKKHNAFKKKTYKATKHVILDSNIFVMIKTYFLPLFKINLSFHRNNPPEVFLVKGVLKVCGTCIEEHPCRCVISIKLHSTLLKSHFDMDVIL